MNPEVKKWLLNFANNEDEAVKEVTPPQDTTNRLLEIFNSLKENVEKEAKLPKYGFLHPRLELGGSVGRSTHIGKRVKRNDLDVILLFSGGVSRAGGMNLNFYGLLFGRVHRLLMNGLRFKLKRETKRIFKFTYKGVRIDFSFGLRGMKPADFLFMDLPTRYAFSTSANHCSVGSMKNMPEKCRNLIRLAKHWNYLSKRLLGSYTVELIALNVWRHSTDGDQYVAMFKRFLRALERVLDGDDDLEWDQEISPWSTFVKKEWVKPLLCPDGVGLLWNPYNPLSNVLFGNADKPVPVDSLLSNIKDTRSLLVPEEAQKPPCSPKEREESSEWEERRDFEVDLNIFTKRMRAFVNNIVVEKFRQNGYEVMDMPEGEDWSKYAQKLEDKRNMESEEIPKHKPLLAAAAYYASNVDTIAENLTVENDSGHSAREHSSTGNDSDFRDCPYRPIFRSAIENRGDESIVLGRNEGLLGIKEFRSILQSDEISSSEKKRMYEVCCLCSVGFELALRGHIKESIASLAQAVRTGMLNYIWTVPVHLPGPPFKPCPSAQRTSGQESTWFESIDPTWAAILDYCDRRIEAERFDDDCATVYLFALYSLSSRFWYSRQVWAEAARKVDISDASPSARSIYLAVLVTADMASEQLSETHVNEYVRIVRRLRGEREPLPQVVYVLVSSLLIYSNFTGETWKEEMKDDAYDVANKIYASEDISIWGRYLVSLVRVVFASINVQQQAALGPASYGAWQIFCSATKKIEKHYPGYSVERFPPEKKMYLFMAAEQRLLSTVGQHIMRMFLAKARIERCCVS